MNILVFAVALAMVLDHGITEGIGPLDERPHWRTGQLDLVVVDHTGSLEWEQATHHAVTAWNAVAAGTGIRLRWESGQGPCRPEATRVAVCQTAYVNLDDVNHLGRQGVAKISTSERHTSSALVQVCEDCRLDSERRRVVAVHEIGHTLGLGHNARAASVMYPTGGPETPDAGDAADLRDIYDHLDDGCGYFNIRLGPFCF